MKFFNRILTLIKEDWGALIPGSGYPLNRHAALRLILHFAFIFFVVQMILISRGFTLSPIFKKTETNLSPMKENPQIKGEVNI